MVADISVIYWLIRSLEKMRGLGAFDISFPYPEREAGRVTERGLRKFSSPRDSCVDLQEQAGIAQYAQNVLVAQDARDSFRDASMVFIVTWYAYPF